MGGMGSPPQQDVSGAVDALAEATSRLLAAVDAAIAKGGPDAFAAPSRLPGWTIGHVVTHLARNADGLRRVLVGAEVGEQLQPYASPEARTDDIEAGALRSTETIATTSADADQELAGTIHSFPDATLVGDGRPRHAAARPPLTSSWPPGSARSNCTTTTWASTPGSPCWTTPRPGGCSRRCSAPTFAPGRSAADPAAGRCRADRHPRRRSARSPAARSTSSAGWPGATDGTDLRTAARCRSCRRGDPRRDGRCRYGSLR